MHFIAQSNVAKIIELVADRSVSKGSAREGWLTVVLENQKADLILPVWFEAWFAATLATDTVGSAATPPVLRALVNVVQDGREYWSAGNPWYDPGQIRVPTFLVHAKWDQDLPSYMLHACFAKRTGAPYQRYVEIGEGTHTIIMEKNRMRLFQAVQQVLDESIQPNL